MIWTCCTDCDFYCRHTIVRFVPYLDADEIVKTTNLLQPDLILLDIKFEHGNGLEICAELKNSNSRLKNIPVFIMSGLPDVEDKSYEAGADYFFAKPFRHKILIVENQITRTP